MGLSCHSGEAHPARLIFHHVGTLEDVLATSEEMRRLWRDEQSSQTTLEGEA
jgi:hypothetical protein